VTTRKRYNEIHEKALQPTDMVPPGASSAYSGCPFCERNEDHRFAEHDEAILRREIAEARKELQSYEPSDYLPKETLGGIWSDKADFGRRFLDMGKRRQQEMLEADDDDLIIEATDEYIEYEAAEAERREIAQLRAEELRPYVQDVSVAELRYKMRDVGLVETYYKDTDIRVTDSVLSSEVRYGDPVKTERMDIEFNHIKSIKSVLILELFVSIIGALFIFCCGGSLLFGAINLERTAFIAKPLFGCIGLIIVLFGFSFLSFVFKNNNSRKIHIVLNSGTKYELVLDKKTSEEIKIIRKKIQEVLQLHRLMRRK